MPRQIERDEERAEADKRPFDDDIRPFGRKSEQKRETDGEIKKTPQHIDNG